MLAAHSEQTRSMPDASVVRGECKILRSKLKLDNGRFEITRIAEFSEALSRIAALCDFDFSILYRIICL